LRLEIFQKRQAVFAWHYHIRKDQVEMLGLCKLKRFGGIVAKRRFMPGQPERA
jgi:hypothetical protein